MRLIDAYSAKEAIEYTLVGDSASMAQRVIDSQPTVDAVPVRHGRWIIDNVNGKIACSDCGCIYLGYNGRLPPNYCPNCGAKMMEG